MRECPVLYPTLDDIRNPFELYIIKHEKKIADAGIAKIVAPEGWSPRRQGYPDDLDFNIERPIRQHATGSRGLYRGLYIEERPLSLLRGFRPQALAPENQPPTATDVRDLERKFWKNVTLRPPLYGADVLGSLFDDDCQGWNLRRLDTVLSRVLHEAGHSLPGVSEPYLYFGTWRSTFAWHTEDLDLYSVNYLHFGAPKQWYCIPPDSRKRFEGLVKGMLPDLFKACPEFFRHKELIISPQLLDTYAIPYIKIVQNPREFIINYPGAYHAGYNCGYNCAESVNFGTKRWVPLGVAAGVCKCNPDSVTIDMSLFRDLIPEQLLPPYNFEDRSQNQEDGNEDEDEENGECRQGVNCSDGLNHRTAAVWRAMAGYVAGSPEEGVDAASAAGILQPPRRRGRPPKRTLLVVDTAWTEAPAPDPKRQCIMQEDGIVVAAPPRRRGRPSKAATIAAATAAAAAKHAVQGPGGVDCGAGTCGNVILHGAPSSVPKTGGWPPKYPMTVGASGTAGVAGAATTIATSRAAVAAAAAAHLPPKRPRGRPRKHPLPPQPSQAAASSTAATAVTAAAAATVAAIRDQELVPSPAVGSDSGCCGFGSAMLDMAFGPLALQHAAFGLTTESLTAYTAAAATANGATAMTRSLEVKLPWGMPPNVWPPPLPLQCGCSGAVTSPSARSGDGNSSIFTGTSLPGPPPTATPALPTTTTVAFASAVMAEVASDGMRALWTGEQPAAAVLQTAGLGVAAPVSTEAAAAVTALPSPARRHSFLALLTGDDSPAQEQKSAW